MNRSVLVVDDISFVRKTLTQIFTEAHFTVVGEAASGPEAIELYQKLRPAIVTLDLVMPQMSGIETARRILRADKDAKIIIISAMGQEHLVMEAINVGARDYMIKPFSAVDVARTAERVLASDERLANRASHREQRSG